MGHSRQPVRQKKNNEGQTLTWNKIQEVHYISGDLKLFEMSVTKTNI
jgi:hypothetical protein